MEQVKFMMTDLSAQTTRQCAQVLQGHDIAVSVCEKDGYKALEAIAQQQPDVVLLDAFMPGLDAITVKRRCDEQGLCPVFFVTGSFTDDQLESEMMGCGFSYYFLKPFDAEALASRILASAGRTTKLPHVAVSYTHLDVYKRQSLAHGHRDQFFCCAAIKTNKKHPAALRRVGARTHRPWKGDFLRSASSSVPAQLDNHKGFCGFIYKTPTDGGKQTAAQAALGFTK